MVMNFKQRLNAHVADVGLENTHIKPVKCRLDDKVEQPHLTDKHKF